MDIYSHSNIFKKIPDLATIENYKRILWIRVTLKLEHNFNKMRNSKRERKIQILEMFVFSIPVHSKHLIDKNSISIFQRTCTFSYHSVKHLLWYREKQIKFFSFLFNQKIHVRRNVCRTIECKGILWERFEILILKSWRTWSLKWY